MRLTKLFNDFYVYTKGGVMLIICMLVSLVLANTAIQNGYLNFWQTPIAGLSIEHWINDGEARIAILFSSLVIGFIGFIWLRSILKNKMKALLISN